jgi:uncharacterized membrane protein YeaQ/YmgE (transglycosylase-associated protein family)
MLWTIITAIIGGLIIGALARLVMPGKQNIGIIMTILLGVVGSFLGSWICWNVFGYTNEGGGWQVIPFLVGIVIAAVLIAIYLAITGRGVKTPRA